MTTALYAQMVDAHRQFSVALTERYGKSRACEILRSRPLDLPADIAALAAKLDYLQAEWTVMALNS